MRRPPADAEDVLVEITQNVIPELAPYRDVNIECPREPAIFRLARGMLSTETPEICGNHRPSFAFGSR